MTPHTTVLQPLYK